MYFAAIAACIGEAHVVRKDQNYIGPRVFKRRFAFLKPCEQQAA